MQQGEQTIAKVKNIEKYEKVFHNSLHFGMVNSDLLNFYAKQIKDVKPAIERTLEYIDESDYPDEKIKENVRMYAVTCLPFMLADFDIINPDNETREAHKQALNWLLYIKNNRGLANEHIRSITGDTSKRVQTKEELDYTIQPDGIIFNYDLNRWEKFKQHIPPIIFDDFYGFNEVKLDTHIALYEWYLSGKRTTNRKFYSNVIQFQYLAKSVDIAWRSESDKLEFLEHFFLENGWEVNSLTIKKQMLIASRKNPMISLSKEKIKEILAQPNPQRTEEELKNYIVNPLDSIILV